ncbi:unnamed protein product [Bursaphelenchus okinawaensis]|uniref:Uncharacterized protein n=1 Tax=Bursaphelenchus okinawaensis TaxID=465554 RepID=A0A811KQ58_9BILA|nr:unnamed protein product [Bursaphelenchus okinawaensis]CAG9111117.1 unnamed protein product [Bursaphelenchus okinawaensis]
MSTGTVSYDSRPPHVHFIDKLNAAYEAKQDFRDQSIKETEVQILLVGNQPYCKEIGPTALKVINRRRTKECCTRKFKTDCADKDGSLMCELIDDAFSRILSKQNKHNLPLRIHIGNRRTPTAPRTIEFTSVAEGYSSTSSESFDTVDETPLVEQGLSEQNLEDEGAARRKKLFPEAPYENRSAPPLHNASEIEKRLQKIGKKC